MSINSGDKSYTCKICEKGFIIQAHLTRHLRTHNFNIFGKGIKVQAALKQHMRIHSELIEERLYTCTICEKAFTELSHLTAHMKMLSEACEEKHYTCGICQKGFQRNLTTHMLTHHLEKPKNGCNKCRKNI